MFRSFSHISNAEPAGLMRPSIIPLLLTMLPLAPAEACVPLMLNVSGKPIKHPGTITLNSDGSWSVKDWATVEESPEYLRSQPAIALYRKRPAVASA